MLVFRRVEYKRGTDIELYLSYKDGQFALPHKIPTRFAERCTAVGAALEIQSSPLPQSTLQNKKVFQDFGVWITRDDCTLRGGLKVPTVYGIAIDGSVVSAWGRLPEPSVIVRVGYHGTSLECWDSIRKSELRPSLGQMGHGVYLGSFWKACRFAARDQAYKWRDRGVLLRVLWEARGEELLVPRSIPCPCDTLCKGRPYEQRLISAHELVWTDSGWGTLQVGQLPSGKWITHNEEWVTAPANVLRLCEAVEIDKSSVSGEKYDPLQRNIECL